MGLCKITAVSALLFYGCCWISTVTLALDMEGALETNCFPMEPVKLDYDWATQQNFYMPIVSRSQLYLITVQLLEPVDPSEVTEASIYYDSCVRWRFFRNSSVIIYGYGGTKQTNYLTGPVPEVNGGYFRPIQGYGYSGTWWTIKTDNKTYAVIVGCTNNKTAWIVLSTMPILPEATVKEITEHLIKIGFKEAYFTGLRYDNCPDEKGLSGEIRNNIKTCKN